MLQIFKRLLLAALMVWALSARAETTLCTEVVPPTDITQPGVYCLLKDYALNLAQGDALRILANNVVLDFNGHRVGNSAAGSANSAVGVRVGISGIWGAQNVVIRNGTLIGFGAGIFADQYTNRSVLVEDMLVDKSLEYGIYADGNGTVVRRNRVIGTGKASNKSRTYGLRVRGGTAVVADNEVINTFGVSTTVGIDVYCVDGAVISGNRVVGLTASPEGSALGIGAFGKAVVSGNTVLAVHESADGFWSSFGNVKVLNNTVSVPGTAYSGSASLIAGTNH